MKLNWALALFDRRLAPLLESVQIKTQGLGNSAQVAFQIFASWLSIVHGPAVGLLPRSLINLNKWPALGRVRNARWANAEARGIVSLEQSKELNAI